MFHSTFQLGQNGFSVPAAMFIVAQTRYGCLLPVTDQTYAATSCEIEYLFGWLVRDAYESLFKRIYRTVFSRRRPYGGLKLARSDSILQIASGRETETAARLHIRSVCTTVRQSCESGRDIIFIIPSRLLHAARTLIETKTFPPPS